jgi:hypothetical protein
MSPQSYAKMADAARSAGMSVEDMLSKSL